MSACPICSSPSADKRIAYQGNEVFDLCMTCASYGVCLISPEVDISVKENALRWAEAAIDRNREKFYLANCIRSWKQCAEDFIAVNTRLDTSDVLSFESDEINLDATIIGFRPGVASQEPPEATVPVSEPAADGFRDVYSSSERIPLSQSAVSTPAKEEEDPSDAVPVEGTKAADAEADAELSVTDYLREIALSLRSLNEKIDRIEKELAHGQN